MPFGRKKSLYVSPMSHVSQLLLFADWHMACTLQSLDYRRCCQPLPSRRTAHQQMKNEPGRQTAFRNEGLSVWLKVTSQLFKFSLWFTRSALSYDIQGSCLECGKPLSSVCWAPLGCVAVADVTAPKHSCVAHSWSSQSSFCTPTGQQAALMSMVGAQIYWDSDSLLTGTFLKSIGTLFF